MAMSGDADDRDPPRRPAEDRSLGSDDARSESETLRLIEEELSVRRERVETGRVRVRVVTHEREEPIEVPVTREHFEVERIAVGREIEAIPPRRQEGDVTIVPVVEEVIVMRRKLVLKEEIHLKLVRTTEQHRQSVTLRRQEAVIERIPVEQQSTEQKPG
jgi:uncharacterized protein (TIGR02271 family)